MMEEDDNGGSSDNEESEQGDDRMSCDSKATNKWNGLMADGDGNGERLSEVFVNKKSAKEVLIHQFKLWAGHVLVEELHYPHKYKKKEHAAHPLDAFAMCRWVCLWIIEARAAWMGQAACFA